MAMAAVMDVIDGGGVRLDRRSALRLGAQAATMLALAAGAGSLTGCAEDAAVDIARHAPLVQALARAVIPTGATPGADAPANVDFVLRAVDAELLKVPRDLLDQLAEAIDAAALLRQQPAEQTQAITRMDAAVFGGAEPRKHPWYATKALILMSYYTSEAGMTRELRYELVPGRYDSDVVVDAAWRPLSNDWSAVSVKKPVRP